MEQNTNKFKNFLGSTAGKWCMIIVLYAVFIGIVAISVDALGSAGTWVIFAFSAALIYFGWKALNWIPIRFFLVLPLGGFILYYVIKGAIALAIGIFVAPYQIAKMVANAVQSSLNDAS